MGRFSLAVLLGLLLPAALPAEPLPETKPLTGKDDLAELMVAGIDRYLMRELAGSVQNRQRFWKVDRSSPEAYDRSVQPNRDRLKTLLGLVDTRVSFTAPEVVAPVGQDRTMGVEGEYRIRAVRWPVLPGMDGEGLLVEGNGKTPEACVVVLPDPDVTPEMAVGMAAGAEQLSVLVRMLVRSGATVVIPVLVDRKDTWSGSVASSAGPISRIGSSFIAWPTRWAGTLWVTRFRRRWR